MKPKVLVTREAQASAFTAAQVNALGFEAVVCPLIEIEPVEYALPKNFEPDYLLVTSLNAAKLAATDLRYIPCLVVGDKSAKYLASKGFNVIGVCEDASHLLSSLRAKGGDKKFLYLSGNHIATNIPKALTSMGHTVKRVVVYKSNILSTLDSKLLKDLSLATFYSPRTAEAFSKLCKGQNLSHITAICLSEAVAKGLEDLQFKEVLVAKEPNENNLLNALPYLKS